MTKRKKFNGFDCDGVITVGLLPQKNDIIITGRSFEEVKETQKYLANIGVSPSIPVYYNPAPFALKTRISSADWKVSVINKFIENGEQIENFFEDDPIQADTIERGCPKVNVVRIVHNLTEKENVRRDEFGNVGVKQQTETKLVDETTIERVTEQTPEPIKKLFKFPYEYFFDTENGKQTGIPEQWSILDAGGGNMVSSSSLLKLPNDVTFFDKCHQVFTPTENKTFITGMLENMPFSDDQFNVTVCFEVIEHLNIDDQRRVLQELFRITAGGLIIGSVNADGPDFIGGEEIFKAKNDKNPFHLSEMNYFGFTSLISSVFRGGCQFFQSQFNDQEKSGDDVLMMENKHLCNLDGICNYVKINKKEVELIY